MLNSVDELLTHIKDVQKDVIELSNESLMKMSSFMEKNSLEIDEDISTALQYQDIITQQLNATIEAIDSMRHSIEFFSHAYQSDESIAAQSMVKLQEKLNATLKDAKDKKNRFSGKFAQNNEDDDIEFF
jgi:predicted RNA-binding protein with EMAP domain